MGVVNSELPKVVTLNGREDGIPWSFSINPGLNTVPDVTLKMMKVNERFRDMVDRAQVNEVKQGKGAASETPADVGSIDITSMNVRNAREVIDSCADVKLLDKWEQQEAEREDGERKGVKEALEAQREKLANLAKPPPAQE